MCVLCVHTCVCVQAVYVCICVCCVYPCVHVCMLYMNVCTCVCMLCMHVCTCAGAACAHVLPCACVRAHGGRQLHPGAQDCPIDPLSLGYGTLARQFRSPGPQRMAGLAPRSLQGAASAAESTSALLHAADPQIAGSSIRSPSGSPPRVREGRQTLPATETRESPKQRARGPGSAARGYRLQCRVRVHRFQRMGVKLLTMFIVKEMTQRKLGAALPPPD